MQVYSRQEIRKYLKLIFSEDENNVKVGFQIFVNNSPQLIEQTFEMIKRLTRLRDFFEHKKSELYKEISCKCSHFKFEFKDKNGRFPNEQELDDQFPEYARAYSLYNTYNRIVILFQNYLLNFFNNKNHV